MTAFAPMRRSSLTEKSSMISMACSENAHYVGYVGYVVLFHDSG